MAPGTPATEVAAKITKSAFADWFISPRSDYVKCQGAIYIKNRQAEANHDENSKKQSSSKSILKQMTSKTSNRISGHKQRKLAQNVSS
jgi:hypothetical protein